MGPAKRDHPMSPLSFCPARRRNPEGRRGSTWVAMGQGTLLVPAAHGRRPTHPTDPVGVELFGPSKADAFLDPSLPWV